MAADRAGHSSAGQRYTAFVREETFGFTEETSQKVEKKKPPRLIGIGDSFGFGMGETHFKKEDKDDSLSNKPGTTEGFQVR